MKTQTSSSKKIFTTLGCLFLVFFLITACAKLYRLYSLKSKMKSYQGKIKELEKLNQNLMDDIGSANDPIWLELALMEELGVIPKDATKINYQEE